jgi:hypothetical protein
VSPAPGAASRRLIVLACVLAAVGIAAPIVAAVRDERPESVERWLRGRTEQRHSVELLVDKNGLLRAVKTRIDAVCKGGYPWHVEWSPTEGYGRFTQHGKRVAVREFKSSPDGEGRISRILVRLEGRVGRHAASGTVRATARFYRDGREVQACESAPRRWTAGAHAARRLAKAPPVRVPRGSYYPKVPSLAGQLSAARRRFISRTDQTCAASYGRTRAASEAFQDAAGDLALQTEFFAAYVDAHNDQLLALEGLGTPPDGVALHRRWLDNFRLRIKLERRVLRLTRAGRIEEARRVYQRLDPLKMAGNEVGQRFGLQVCTSNGPDRTAVQR